MSWRALAAVASCGAISGCASFVSEQATQANLHRGLIYYLPKKDIVLNVTVADDSKGGVTTVADVTVSTAYPDVAKPFVLRYQANAIAKNTMEIGISPTGLLTSASNKSVVQLDQALGSIASLAGMGVARSAAPLIAAPRGCQKPGVYTFVYKLPDTGASNPTPCGIAIGIHKATMSTVLVDAPADVDGDGLYYRQPIPYAVTVSNRSLGVDKEFLVFSPSESNTFFLPLGRSVFANNDSSATLIDGVVTYYKRDTDGELVALLKLPAAIISAYFGAIGSLFDSFATQDTKEAAAMTSSLKLELAKQKYQACLAAVKNKDSDAIKTLGCEQ